LALFSSEPSYPVLLLGAGAMGVASGGILPIWNAIVPVIFGVQNFGRTMGWMMPVIGVILTPSYLIVGSIRDSTGSYVLAFQVFLGVLVAAILLVLPLRVGGTESAA
jgi:MFS family permease